MFAYCLLAHRQQGALSAGRERADEARIIKRFISLSLPARGRFIYTGIYGRYYYSSSLFCSCCVCCFCCSLLFCVVLCCFVRVVLCVVCFFLCALFFVRVLSLLLLLLLLLLFYYVVRLGRCFLRFTYFVGHNGGLYCNTSVILIIM